jgi:hypothetical protein
VPHPVLPPSRPASPRAWAWATTRRRCSSPGA